MDPQQIIKAVIRKAVLNIDSLYDFSLNDNQFKKEYGFNKAELKKALYPLS